MVISNKAKKEIYNLIDKLVSKYIKKIEKDGYLNNSGNPFIMALFSDFEPILHTIHGIKTSLGGEMEKIAEIIAKDAWGEKNVKRKINRDVILPKNVYSTIDSILNNLSNARTLSDYYKEKEQIKEALKTRSKETESHIYEFDLEIYDEIKKHYYFMEMKGPDPNTTEVPGAKRRLLAELAWGYQNLKMKEADALFAIYYNNKFPKPYKNPKVLYYFNPQGGLLVHEYFWNFIGRNETTYKELVKVFESYGKANKEKIWDSFSKLIKK